MTVSDNPILAEGLCDFSRSLCKTGLNASRKMAKKVSKNHGRTLEIAAYVGTAFASQTFKATLSTLPDVITFYHFGNGFYVAKPVYVYCVKKMTTPILKLFHSAPLENNDSEQKLQRNKTL